MRIHVDDDEIEMLIEFQGMMACDAEESGKHEEAKNRRQRAKDLRQLLDGVKVLQSFVEALSRGGGRNE